MPPVLLLSNRDELESAGAVLEDRAGVDHNLVTAQHYTNLPDFTKAFLALLH